MARLTGKFIGRNRDFPMLEAYAGTAISAGSASDFEHIIATVPDLTYLASSGTVGDIPLNVMSVRFCVLVFEATLTGANTNYCTFNFNQRRAGSLLVSTTASTAVAAAGSVVITPASMANIAGGVPLNISGGTGTAETIIPYNITPTTFTANFANTHSSTYNIVSAPLASIAFVGGTNASAYVPIQFPRIANTVKAGDVITIARVSSNSTGLASPAYYAAVDWSAAGVG